MKKTTALLCSVGLLALLALPPAFSAKPVDNDGDGVKSNVDCNDNDPTVSSLNSCGECAVEPPAGCSGPNCTDADGDTFAIEGGSCGPIDCDDTNLLIYPNAPEVCGDGVDQSCSGADQQCPTGDHSNLTWSDYPSACMNCHDNGSAGSHYDEMWDTTHYQWLGEAPDMVNEPNILQGKLTNAVNSYCINIEGDWPVCGSCHAGRGVKPGTSGDSKANIDCLVCHNADYAWNRVRLPDGSMGPSAGTDQATLDSYVQNIGKPTRASCLKCHAFAGGGDGVKRGDLSSAQMDNTDPHFDVHMNSAGSDVQCQDCHVFQAHKTIGKGSDLRPTDDLTRGSEVSCVTCHQGMDSGTGHASVGRRSEPDRHVARVACQSCHIPTYAKAATEVHRDWRTHHDGSNASTCDPDNGETPCPGHPHVDKLANLIPTLKFWDGTSDNYLLGDAAQLDPATGAYPTSRPLGDVHSGMLTPFKYKTADQPMTIASKQLIALDTYEYIKASGDVEKSIESGLVNMGLSANEGYEWVVTDTYQMINHGVNPASDVADCSQCHQGTLDVNSHSLLDSLGYQLKGDKEQVCNQCHDGGKKLPRTWDKMHNHVEKGNGGIGCYFCHDFVRPERNLCNPCDSSCSAEYLDPARPLYPHDCSGN